MTYRMLKAKIHRATVTSTDLHYEGSVSIDQDVLEASGILEFESVDIWDINNGARLSTYTIAAPRGSGEICLNGAAARHVHRGDYIIIAAFSQMEEKEARTYKPRVILMDDKNRILSYAHTS